MNRQAQCPQCRSPLPADAPEGLCPQCLLKAGLAISEISESFVQTGKGFESTELPLMKPKPEEFAADSMILDEAPGRYSQRGEHSRGGMGRILLVHDQIIGRDIALKELLPPAPRGSGDTPVRHVAEVSARFLREAQLTGQLEHPGIVPVYEVGHRADGTLYYTMKLVRGKTLHEAVVQTKTASERMKLLPHVVDLCQAIAFAHSRGVIHRDIKPRNVMVGEFGETVVIDWGLAKSHASAASPGEDGKMASPEEYPSGAAVFQTADGTVLGTAAYMAPEQAAGDVEHVDERSDVYALGAVLYEVLTGQPPFTGTSAMDILDKVSSRRPAPVLQVERQIPSELAAICERAMARNPADRHPSAKELAEDIQAFITGRVFREREARVSFLAAVYGVGAMLIAAGIITLVVYNWKRIPPNGQAVLIVTTMMALLGSGLYFRSISGSRPQLGHVLIFLGVLMFGIDLLLLCHIYHIPLSGSWGLAGRASIPGATPEHILFLFWALGSFAVAAVIRSNSITMLSLVVSLLWFLEGFFVFSSGGLQPQVYGYPILVAAIFVPVCYGWGTARAFGATMVAVSVTAVAIAIADGGVGRFFLAALAMAMLFLPWGLLSYSGPYRKRAGENAVGLGTAFLVIPLVAMSSWHAQEVFNLSLAGNANGLKPFVPLAAAALVAAGLWVWTILRKAWPAELRLLLGGFAAVTAIVSGALVVGWRLGPSNAAPTGLMLAAILAANLAVLVFGATIAWTGVTLLNRCVFWAGTLFVAAMAVWRIFEFQMDFQLRALILVCAGIGLIVIGMRFESYLKRRRLV
ncbi:MAG TPA: DUF2157 domain-containing protein [Candidatus Hydrogenedentes bacterium]|nr:DUF2157 domain-containing protein [Candidatus Hydrogenedentota bacterium]